MWYYEKRGALGIRWQPRRNIAINATGGYAFDRFWFEGETYRDRMHNRIKLDPGPFASIRLEFVF